MDAKEGKILRLLEGSDKKFIIPAYQRSYDWKIENCKLLLNDLLNMFRFNHKSHFFGSIVYVSNEVGGVNEYIIIDGQQRLITISLLLIAIKNYFIVKKLISSVISPSKIEENYIRDKYANDEKKLKLKLIEGDDEAFERIINNSDKLKGNRVTENYEFFYRELEKLSISEIEGVYESITKLMIVNISLKPNDGDDDPQLVFESLNSAGLLLSEADKIRNFVLMKLNNKDQEKCYKQYWKIIEELVGKGNMDSFIRYYLTAKIYDSVSEKDLYFSFKNYREKNALEIEEFLLDIKLYAGFYKEIFASTNLTYRDDLIRINRLETNTIVPLLLDLLKSHDDGLTTDLEIKEAIITLENYLVRRTICGLSVASMNKTLAVLPKEIRKHIEDGASYIEAFKFSLLSRSQKTRYPNDSEFVDKLMTFELYNAKSSFRKYVFERLENYNNKEIVNVPQLLDDKKLTIEHVMPQTLTLEWRRELGDNWELIHSKYLHTIGNLTLSAYNSDYSNLSFIKKKTKKDTGFIYSKLQLNDYIKCQDTWGEKEILERAKILADISKKIWFLPKSSFIPLDTTETLTLDDDVDFTSRQVQSYTFLGETVKTDNMTDFYLKIFKTLCDLDKTLLIQNANRYYGPTLDGFRNGKQICDDFYVETNLSSNDKIKVIKDALSLLSIDQSDVFFTLNKGFDIDDVSTYFTKKIGDLAYTLFENLLTNDCLKPDEINNLKDKIYSHSLFAKLHYPVLSVTQDAFANGSTKRYYKDAVNMYGVKYYISSQWFEEDRDAIIKYYSEHLK